MKMNQETAFDRNKIKRRVCCQARIFTLFSHAVKIREYFKNISHFC